MSPDGPVGMQPLGARTVTLLPGHQHQPRSPLVPVPAPLGVGPPRRTPHSHLTIRTPVRHDDVRPGIRLTLPGDPVARRGHARAGPADPRSRGPLVRLPSRIPVPPGCGALFAGRIEGTLGSVETVTSGIERPFGLLHRARASMTASSAAASLRRRSASCRIASRRPRAPSATQRSSQAARRAFDWAGLLALHTLGNSSRLDDCVRLPSHSAWVCQLLGSHKGDLRSSDCRPPLAELASAR